MTPFHDLRVGLAAAAGWLGLSQPPVDDAGRVARIDALYEDYRAAFPTVPSVDVPTLQQWLGEGRPVVLVDVRSVEERAISTLPGAIRSEVVDADPTAFGGRLLVAYCTIGYRSGKWAASRRAEGLDVRNLQGSVLAWTHSGRDLEGPAGPTRAVHVVGPTWDLARTDFQAVW